MKSLLNAHVVFVDVDNTLLFWPEDFDGEDERIKNKPTVMIKGKAFVPNYKLIDTIKKYHAMIDQGFIVWSSGGGEWAKLVVEALGLEEYIAVTTSKPFLWIDDGPAHSILHDNNYKKPYKGK